MPCVLFYVDMISYIFSALLHETVRHFIRPNLGLNLHYNYTASYRYLAVTPDIISEDTGTVPDPWTAQGETRTINEAFRLKNQKDTESCLC